MPSPNKPSQPKSRTLITLLQKIESLADLTEGAQSQEIFLKAGDILMKEGEGADHMYYLLSGSLGVRARHSDGSEKQIDTLTAETTVGELALMNSQKRTATVVALEDSNHQGDLGAVAGWHFDAHDGDQQCAPKCRRKSVYQFND